MKYLIWKLSIDSTEKKYRKYSVEYRWWFVITYWIITSPLILLLWIFKKLDKWYWKPFQVYERTIESSNHDLNTKRAIFKKLIE